MFRPGMEATCSLGIWHDSTRYYLFIECFSVTFSLERIELTGHISCGKAGFLIWITNTLASLQVLEN
jgi:hypothetical protein